jgi:hypothetical protein
VGLILEELSRLGAARVLSPQPPEPAQDDRAATARPAGARRFLLQMGFRPAAGGYEWKPRRKSAPPGK